MSRMYEHDTAGTVSKSSNRLLSKCILKTSNSAFPWFLWAPWSPCSVVLLFPWTLTVKADCKLPYIGTLWIERLMKLDT